MSITSIAIYIDIHLVVQDLLISVIVAGFSQAQNIINLFMDTSNVTAFVDDLVPYFSLNRNVLTLKPVKELLKHGIVCLNGNNGNDLKCLYK